MALLILNAGSSSLKFGLMNPADHRVFIHGTIELGLPNATPSNGGKS